MASCSKKSHPGSPRKMSSAPPKRILPLAQILKSWSFRRSHAYHREARSHHKTYRRPAANAGAGFHGHRTHPPLSARDSGRRRLARALPDLGPPALHAQPHRSHAALRTDGHLLGGRADEFCPQSSRSELLDGCPDRPLAGRELSPRASGHRARQFAPRAAEYNRNEYRSSLRGRSQRSRPSRHQPPRIRGARGKPSCVLAPLRHLRRLLARARDMRRNPTPLHHRIRQSEVGTVTSKSFFGVILSGARLIEETPRRSEEPALSKRSAPKGSPDSPAYRASQTAPLPNFPAVKYCLVFRYTKQVAPA